MTRFQCTNLPAAAMPMRRRAGRHCRPAHLTALLVAGLLGFVVGVAFAAGEAQAGYNIHLFLANGGPASRAVVRVMGPDGEMPSVTADDMGRVRVEGLKPGEAAFFLATSADGRESMFEPVLVVPEGLHTLTLRLYPPCSVIGELLDERGGPVLGVAVRVASWDWLEAHSPTAPATTDAKGQFKVSGLIPGAYYTVAAAEVPADAPKRTWSSASFTIFGWDGWYNVGILLPAGSESAAPRPEGTALARIISGTDDEWYDVTDQRWRPAVETYDPNRSWAPPPDSAVWIWRAGRPEPAAEQSGATVEFRKLFTVPPGKKVVGYLTIGADDYAAIRLNGHWVGQTNQFYRVVTMTVPSDLLRPGENELRITLRNIAMTNRDIYNPTGVTYELELIEPKG